MEPRPRQELARERARRPRSIVAVSVLLIMLGVVCALAGIAASAVSSCCGSPDPADPRPAFLGLGVAAAVSAAGVGMWSGRASRRVLLLCAAALPVAVLAISPTSSDLQGLAPFVVGGWLWLWWYLRRPLPLKWLGGHGR